MRKRLHQFIGLLAFTLVVTQASAQSVCTMDSSYNYNSNNVLTSKDYYFYDANGWQTEWITKDSVNGSWVKSHRYTYTYNLTGKQTSYLYQQWVNNAWRNLSRRMMTYNSNDDFLANTDEYWDTLTSTWILNGNQYNNTYNANFKKTQMLQVYVSNGVVIDSSRTTYTYNANNKEHSQLRQAWTSSSAGWYNQQIWYNVYNTNNQLDSTFNCIWNPNTLVFDTSYLTTYSFDSQGNTTANYNFQINGSNWENMSKQTYTFDANNNPTGNSYYNWNNTTSTWLQMSQQIYTFNANNQSTHGLSLNYNSNLGMLVNSYQSTYTYDANDNPEYIISESWNLNTSSWQLSSKVRYFYNCGALGLEENTPLSVNCYPNPASQLVSIELTEESPIEIYSISGIKMATFASQLNHQVDVSAYPEGIYLVKTDQAVSKFVKK